MTSKGAGLAELRKEFPAHHISKLPKETRAQIDARKTDRNVMVFNCEVCGGRGFHELTDEEAEELLAPSAPISPEYHARAEAALQATLAKIDAAFGRVAA